MDMFSNIIALITGLLGLITAGVTAFFAIKSFINATKNKNAQEIWNMIMEVADAAMKEAEATGASGADKKTQVIETVKASCKAAGVNLDQFIDQLSTYIDQCISFANSIKNKN